MHEMRNRVTFHMCGRLGLKSLFAAALFVIFLPVARAQQDEEQKGIEQGNYNIKQSIEFGGRFTSLSGDFQAYDTFVNLQQGPRLLGFTMEMRSLDHHATLFDRFYFSNFGYGGDPNMASRLRAGKNKWYNFDALFRKDQIFWDYSLQANPLNPNVAVPNAPAGFTPIAVGPASLVGTPLIGISPHYMNRRRKLGNYALTLLPTSRVRFRLGYARNISEGPAFSTVHQGTEQFLLTNYKNTVNEYRLGVDFRLLPRTNISYDQIWNYYKGDYSALDANTLFIVGSTTNPGTATPGVPPVDLGVSWNPGANQPCANTFQTGGFVNPACSAYFSFLLSARARNNFPTEQISLQSNYWKDLDLSAKLSYSGGDINTFGYQQGFTGRESRTNLANDLSTGPFFGRRVATFADFGATWRITDKLSFIDSFHFGSFRDPARYTQSDCGFYSANLTTPVTAFATTATPPITCTPPAGIVPGTTALTHSSSSSADAALNLNSNFLKQDEKTNLAVFQYQFTRRFGARLGFRNRHRAIADNFFTAISAIYYPSNAARGNCAFLPAPAPPNTLPAGCTQNPDGSISFVSPGEVTAPDVSFFNEYSGVFGIWAQPTTNFRIIFDMELMSADNSFTRISPRQSQDYRVRSRYKLTDWLSLNGSLRILEARDNVVGTNNLQHDRAYGISAILQPNEKYSLEIGYDYNDVFSQILICYILASGPTPTTCVTPFIEQLSTYTNKSHYGYFDASWTPFHQLTARLGANLTGTSGSALLLNPNAVSGPLDSKWLHPYGGLDYHFARNWTGKAYWDFYGYHEDPTAGTVTGTFAPQDVFAPRNFRGNLVTLSLRYAF